MNYSYTQISRYLTCPRRYRHHYLDGWQEKDVRAAMLFGRAFELAVAALLRHEDPATVLFEQRAACKNLGLVYSGSDTRTPCCSKASCWNALSRTAAFRFPGQKPAAGSVNPNLACLQTKGSSPFSMRLAS